MTKGQKKAAQGLKNALQACADEGLQVMAYTDCGMYVMRDDEPFLTTQSNEKFQAWLEEKGIRVNPPSLIFDGGAGV